MNRFRVLSALVILAGMLAGLLVSVPEGLAQPPEPTDLSSQAWERWVVRAYYDDPQRIYEVAWRAEPWEVNAKEGYVVVEVDPSFYEYLLQAGFRLEKDEELTAQLHQVNTYLPGQVDGIPGYPCYRTVEETFAAAEQIVADYPNLASWIDIGDSWEKTMPGGEPGYDIMVLRLTNANVPGPKPSFLANSAIHAREYTTAELNTRFAEYLVQNYDVDPDVTWLLDYHEIHLLLHLNPDGRKIAEGGVSWRKNTDNDDGCNDPNSWGVDLNRNFDFLWACCGGSSGNPCAETYHGPSAASEPEIQALQDYARSIFPDQREDPVTATAPLTSTGIWLDLHSYSQLVLWSWGFTPDPAPNSTGLQTLGRKMAFFNGYEPRQAFNLYPTDGSTKDFSYGDLGVPGYTIELGTAFFQDCATFENIILPDNLQMLFYAAKAVRFSYLLPSGPEAVDLTVIPGVVEPGDPVQLTATIDDTRYNNSNGFEPTQDIAAAEYYVDVPPWVTTTTPIAYPMAPVDGGFDETIEEVEATIDTTSLSPGRHILFVRGQDADGNWGVVSAVFLYLTESGVAPVIEGYVRDVLTNDPLDAVVTANAFQANTDPATGYYSMTVVSGTYDMSALADGYAISTVTGIEAHDYESIQQDFVLYPVCEVFADDVESGNQGWTAEGQWAITTEASHSPSHSWTDSPGGNYGNYWDFSLVSPVFDLSGYQGVELEFWHIYDLETGYDYGYVEYSTDGGGSWATVASYDGYGHTTWEQETLAIPELDGQANARLRFRIDTDGGVTADGWHLDDIVLLGGGPACGEDQPPTADFTSNSPVQLGEEMVFTNLTTGTLPISYSWDFGDGVGTSTEVDPVYTYLTAGTFTVTLQASNSVGSDSVSHAVEVLPVSCEPVAILGILTETAGCVVTYTAELSGTGPYSYSWDFGFGSSEAPSATVDYGSSGVYPYTLTVVNCAGAYSDTYADVVTVSCCEGVEVVTVTTGISGCVVDFGAQLSGDLPFTYTWDFGAFGSSSAPTPTVDFGSTGSYTYSLTVVNACGQDIHLDEVTVSCVPSSYEIYLPLVSKSTTP
jgi:PKD repeat protein